MSLGNWVELTLSPTNLGCFSIPSLEEKHYCYKLLLNFQFYYTSFSRSTLICPCGFLVLEVACGVKYLMSFADFHVNSYGIRAIHHVVFPLTGFT